MAKNLVSAGALLYRLDGDRCEVLLVHPSGNYNKRAPWSIPKGLPEPDETTEAAARRETLEETGVSPAELVPLGSVDYTKSKKTVVAYAGVARREDAARPASWEVDRAEFVDIEIARTLLHPDQRPLLDRLVALLHARKR